MGAAQQQLQSSFPDSFSLAEYSELCIFCLLFGILRGGIRVTFWCFHSHVADFPAA